jgi:hypothetical protein
MRSRPHPVPDARATHAARLARLERRVRRLQGAAAALAGTLLVTLLVAMRARSAETAGAPAADVLRVRGLVVEDAEGRPRVVLGAPVGELPGRRRADASTGLLVLDEDGDDRLSVGSPTIAPQVAGRLYERVAAGTGLVVNDDKGNERAGFGHLANGRVVLGLDHERGEGVVLFIDSDNGYQGLLVNGPSGEGSTQRLFLGTSVEGGQASGGVLVLNNEDASRHTMVAGQGRANLPTVVVHKDGEPARDLAAPQQQTPAPGAKAPVPDEPR